MTGQQEGLRVGVEVWKRTGLRLRPGSVGEGFGRSWESLGVEVGDSMSARDYNTGEPAVTAASRWSPMVSRPNVREQQDRWSMEIHAPQT